MVFVFYNKFLLRASVFLTGALSLVCAWHYIALSAQKLGAGGVRDALAIISFLVAGWLVMLIAEVIDNHYVRAFGCMCYGVGAFVSFPWIFHVDGPKLAELPGGAQKLQLAALAFWLAAGLAGLELAILITRLILDKANYGRQPLPVATQVHDAVVGPALPGQGQPAAEPAALQPLTIDQTPLLGGAPSFAAVAVRTPAPVKRFSGVGGMYLGVAFDLHPGSATIGRQDADILLDKDNQVSRLHAAVEVGADGLATLRDTGSTNGTWVNNNRVTEIVLAPGDTVQIGTSQFKVEA
jgi:hypothetical protein